MDRLGLRTRRGALVGGICALALIALPALIGGSGKPAGETTVLDPRISPALASPTPAKRRARNLPNIIVITTDDHARSVYGRRFMPQTFATLARHPDTAQFTQALALPPVCCPYRASFLTGQYPHNNGVFSNKPGYKKLRAKRNVLPAWLQKQGYYTAVAGKYLNGTAPVLKKRGDAQAPGWDEWFVRTGESNSYFDVEFRDRRSRGRVNEVVIPPDSSYFTDVITDRVTKFLGERARANEKGRRQPFFLWVPHLAPHNGDDLDGGDQNACSRHLHPSATDERLAWARNRFDAESEIRKLPAFGEPDNSDKPKRTRRLERIDDEKAQVIAQGFECAAAAIKSVDESNAAIWSRLGQLDLRRETIIVFTSDNGFFFGEHRLGLTKGASYEPALRIPLLITVPPRYNRNGQSPPAKVGAITGQIDLAPTILDYAGAPRASCISTVQCRTMDGKSLRAVLGDRAQRKIARLNASSFAGRGMLIERVRPCFWPALRTPRVYYAIIPADGHSKKPGCGRIADHELYDLKRDPDEERNLAERRRWRRKIKNRYLPQLQRLRRCKGVAKRDDRQRRKPHCE